MASPFYLSGTLPAKERESTCTDHGSIGTLKTVKRWQYVVLIGIGMLGIVYVYLNRVDLGLSRPSPQAENDAGGEPAAPGSHPAQITWEKVERSSDGFKIEMPAEIKDLQIPAFNETGGQEPVNMILSNADADTIFAVAWADDPPVARTNDRNPGKILDTARDDAMARTQTSLTGESRSDIDGFPARDFSAQNFGGGVMNSRLIYASPRLYMLIAAFPSVSARRDQDVARFFNSFAVVSSAAIPQTLPLAPPKN